MARILVIDDDASLLQMMSLMLKRAGHEPILATNGKEGINVARNDDPALAIVDIMMPELNGYEVCRILREDPETTHIPLLVLTALSQPEQREMAIEAGADDFVTKPVTRDDLVTHVDNLLETGPRNEPVPMPEAPPPAAPPPSSAPGYQSMPPVAPPQPSQPPAPTAPVETGLPLVAIMGLGSGVGTTTIAVNLALSKMYAGRVCLVDLDNQVGKVAMHLRMMPPRATWQNLMGVAPGADKRLIGSALMVDQQTGLAILAGPTQPTQEQLSAGTLTYLFQVLAEGFASVVLDLAPVMTPMTTHALRSARSVVLVVGEDPAALMTLRSTIANIESLGLSSPLNLVLNHTRPHGISAEDLMNTVGYPLTANVPYNPDQVNAVTRGQPLAAYKPESLFARTVQQLARQV